MILLDEQLTGLKPFLSSLDWEITTVNNEGLNGRPDQKLLEYAIKNNMTLVTQDTQLAQLAELHNLPHVWVSFAKLSRLVDEELKNIDKNT